LLSEGMSGGGRRGGGKRGGRGWSVKMRRSFELEEIFGRERGRES
jgi:hypothetical protein